MTKEELSLIYYLNREVKMWQRELDQIRAKSLVQSPKLDSIGGHTTGNTSDPVGDVAGIIADIELIIEGRLKEIQIQRKRILDYIDGIEDSLIKQVIFLRCLSNLSWKEVSDEIDGNNSPVNLRQMFHRYLKSH